MMDNSTSKVERVAEANKVIAAIAGSGERLFSHNGEVSKIELRANRHLVFRDAASGASFSFRYDSRWEQFSGTRTMEILLRALADYIRSGDQLPPQWFSDDWPPGVGAGGLWGCGADVAKVRQAILATKVVSQPEEAGDPQLYSLSRYLLDAVTKKAREDAVAAFVEGRCADGRIAAHRVLDDLADRLEANEVGPSIDRAALLALGCLRTDEDGELYRPEADGTRTYDSADTPLLTPISTSLDAIDALYTQRFPGHQLYVERREGIVWVTSYLADDVRLTGDASWESAARLAVMLREAAYHLRMAANLEEEPDIYMPRP